MLLGVRRRWRRRRVLCYELNVVSTICVRIALIAGTW